MLAVWVTVKIKPELRQEFLDAIEVDAIGSERDEPGCARFNVLQDAEDENTYYFYEVLQGRSRPRRAPRRPPLRRMESRRPYPGRTHHPNRNPIRIPNGPGLLVSEIAVPPLFHPGCPLEDALDEYICLDAGEACV